jgi:hypothetical protein
LVPISHDEDLPQQGRNASNLLVQEAPDLVVSYYLLWYGPFVDRLQPEAVFVVEHLV